MNTVHKRITANIRRILLARTLLADHLCDKADIDPGNFSKFMAGKKGITLQTIEKIAQALEIDIYELFKKHGTDS